MKNTAKSVFWGLFAAVTLLAAGSAQADRYSFGLGVSNGEGGFFSFGMSNGGGDRHGGGHGYRGHGYGAPCGTRPMIYAPRPVVCVPPPVVCAPHVRTVVVNSGYWLEREARVWVEGFWSESVDAYGRRCRVWQPGRWEIRRTREWVQQ